MVMFMRMMVEKIYFDLIQLKEKEFNWVNDKNGDNEDDNYDEILRSFRSCIKVEEVSAAGTDYFSFKTFSNLDNYIFDIRTNTFWYLDKYILAYAHFNLYILC